MQGTNSLRAMACVLLLGLCSVLLISSPAFAQADPTPAQNQYAPGPDNECPGAKVVKTFKGTGDKTSAPFQITGTRFRITIANVATSQDPSLSSVSVYVRKTNDDPVENFSKEGPGEDSSIVNAGPGEFFIRTITANAKYTVVIEDCVGTQGNPPANPTNPPANPTPPTAPGNPTKPGGMVPGTNPGGTLADTGGLSPAFVALALGLALLGSGLFIYTSVRRGR